MNPADVYLGVETGVFRASGLFASVGFLLATLGLMLLFGCRASRVCTFFGDPRQLGSWCKTTTRWPLGCSREVTLQQVYRGLLPPPTPPPVCLLLGRHQCSLQVFWHWLRRGIAAEPWVARFPNCTFFWHFVHGRASRLQWQQTLLSNGHPAKQPLKHKPPDYLLSDFGTDVQLCVADPVDTADIGMRQPTRCKPNL